MNIFRKIGIVLLLVTVFLIPVYSYAAIAFDTYTLGVSAGELQNASFSHTTSGTARGLEVYIFANNSGDAVTGVTYNGVAMTQVAKKVRSDYALQYVYLYWLPNAALGAHNVVISTSVSITNSTAYAVSYTGTYNGAVENSGTAATGSGTASASATTIDSGAWLIGGATNFCSDSSLTASTNYTERNENVSVNVGDSNGTAFTPGSNSLTLTLTSCQWAMIVASIAPGTEAAAITPNFGDLVLFGDW